jgi:hypothetical protein
MYILYTKLNNSKHLTHLEKLGTYVLNIYTFMINIQYIYKGFTMCLAFTRVFGKKKHVARGQTVKAEVVHVEVLKNQAEDICLSV